MCPAGYVMTGTRKGHCGSGTGLSILCSKVDGVEILSLILGVIIVIGLGMYYIILVNGVDILKYIPKKS